MKKGPPPWVCVSVGVTGMLEESEQNLQRLLVEFDPHALLAQLPRRHGDKSAEHGTMTSNMSLPANMAFSMDENGTIIPDGRTTEPTELPALPIEGEVLYEYEYDSYGNWTQLTQSHSYGPDSPPNIRHRKLTYY